MMELPCPPELWSDFSRLLDEALALPANERERWLTELPTAHDALIPYLRTVLKQRPSTQSEAALQTPYLSPDTATTRRLAGDPIGPYILIRPLGSGGMGEVHLYFDLKLSRPVAIKRLSTNVLGRQDAVERFLREEEVGLLKAVREGAGWNLFRITAHFILDYGQEGIDPAGGGRHANAWLKGPEISGEAAPSGVAWSSHAGGIDLWAG
jgi:hypothetical protein